MDLSSFAAGLEEQAKDLSALQMSIRAIAVYVAVLIIVRFGKKRFMGRATAFDVIVGIVLGSVASRAITGNAPFLPAMVACATIMVLHWLFSATAVRWHRFGVALKGRSSILVQDGETNAKALRQAHMTDRDLAEALRLRGITDPAEIAEARLERGGDISVIRKKAAPEIDQH